MGKRKVGRGSVCYPTPWATDSECGDESVLDASGRMVADCAIFGAGRTQESNRITARLVAAIPEMLQALRSCDQILRECASVGDFKTNSPFMRELSTDELGRLWIETGQRVQALIAAADGE